MPTAFDRLLGETQGRIAPVNANPPAGEFVFALGSDTRGASFPLNVGDYARVEQTADVTGLKLIRFQAILRPPETVPTGTRWVFEWGLGSTAQGRREFSLGETLRIADGAVNVASLVGDQTIFFRLLFTFAEGAPLLTENGDNITTESGDPLEYEGS